MAPKYSPSPGYSTPQRPRNLLNKEEASRPSAWAPHFPPGLGSIRLPILTLFRGTYFADPFVSWQDNQYKPDNHEHGGSGGPSLRGRGKAMTMSLGVPGMTRRQTAVDLCLQVSSSRNSFSSHNGATVRQGKKKKKNHFLLLSCHLLKLNISTSQQTASCWLDFCRVAETLPSKQRWTRRHQKPNYIHYWGHRCFLQIIYWRIF